MDNVLDYSVERNSLPRLNGTPSFHGDFDLLQGCRVERFFTRLKAVPLPRGLRAACSNALRTNLSLGTLALRAKLSMRASSFSGMVQVSRQNSIVKAMLASAGHRR
jgi:hypothetical protein